MYWLGAFKNVKMDNRRKSRDIEMDELQRLESV